MRKVEDPRRFDEQRAETAEVFLDNTRDVVVNNRILLRRDFFIDRREVSWRVFASLRDEIIAEFELNDPNYQFPEERDSDKIGYRVFHPQEKGRVFAGYEYDVRILDGRNRKPLRLLVACVSPISIATIQRTREDPVITFSRIRTEAMTRDKK